MTSIHMTCSLTPYVKSSSFHVLTCTYVRQYTWIDDVTGVMLHHLVSSGVMTPSSHLSCVMTSISSRFLSSVCCVRCAVCWRED
mmetsp:Transcript_64125/g.93887  ORF Transcript_64125/g.93887 Transcript_64125/m.93887 type:complete len:84 (-) Transcript_64125:1063-1314(-)